MVLKLGVVLGSVPQWGEAHKLSIGSKSRGKQQQQPKSVFCGLRRQQQQRRLAVVRASGDNVEVQVKEVEEVETMEELADIFPSGEWPENFSLLNFEDLSKHYEPILFKLEVCHGLQTTSWVVFLFSSGLGYSISLFKQLIFSMSHTNKKERKKERKRVSQVCYTPCGLSSVFLLAPSLLGIEVLDPWLKARLPEFIFMGHCGHQQACYPMPCGILLLLLCEFLLKFCGIL